MNAFLNSLKSDLLNKRFLPVLVVVGVALVAAVAYAVLGGSSTSPSTPRPTASSGATSVTKGIVVTQSTTGTNKAVAETTTGAPKHPAKAKNPFKPLPSSKAKSASSASTGTASSGASTGSSSSSASGSAGASAGTSSSSSGSSSPSPAPTPKPARPKKPATVYHVSVQFGLAPSAPGQSAQLTSYTDIKRLTPLPSSTTPIVVFAGVTSPGKSATFQLVGEVILHGPAACLPSSSQCQAIGLKPGQTEQLEYLPPSGVPVLYELTLTSISSSKASMASAASAFHAESSAGRKELRRVGLGEVPGLRYAFDTGVLVPLHSAISAHAARQR